MAEQEACTALVDEATRDETPMTPTTPTAPGQLEGESQLLPLLQGLLDAPDNDITPDSGTESGEDQRSGLIVEVQTALEKLSNSLMSDQTDITPERRSSLLQLVTKLQAGLSGSGANERRASTLSTGGRFQKRKKQARHTVGVSKEELADARKLIEHISLNESLNELTPSDSALKLHLSKQNSESSVPTSSASSSSRNVHHKVKNATAKPFSSSNSTTSSVQTPTEHFDGFDVLFNDEKDVAAQCAASVQQKTTPTGTPIAKPSLDRTTSVDSNASIKSAYKAVQQAAASKVAALKHDHSKDEHFESEEEDESSTIKGANDLENASLKNNPIYFKPTLSHEERSSRFDTQKKLRMKRANTIDIPKPHINFYEDEDESESELDDPQRRRDSYNALRGPLNVGNPHTKKIVPIFEPKTDSDKKFLAFINKHNENSSNKGSMWASNTSVWGNKFGNIKNTFEKSSAQDAKSFWKSTDDNITKSSTNQFGPKISRRSARNLQQMFEEKQKETQKTVPRNVYPNQIKTAPVQNNSSHVPNQVKTSPLQNHSSPVYQPQNIVTGTLQVKKAPEKQYRVVPQPLPVNQFSHAPQSAFRPITKTPQSPSKRTSIIISPDGSDILKREIKDNNGPSFLYSPKPISSSLESSTGTSPVASKPWAANSGGSRVLSLAASKFEQPFSREPPKPRILNKDVGSKVFAPTHHINSNVVDKTSSYLAKSAESNSSTVRKLSGQYENYNNAVPEHQPKPQTYQVKTSVIESQYTQPIKHYEPRVKAPTQISPMPPSQNYSIRYDQPQNYTVLNDQGPLIRSKNYPNPTNFQQPQNYSIRYDRPQNQQLNQNQHYQSQPMPQNYVRYDEPHAQQYPSQHPQQPLGQSQPLNYSIRYDRPQFAQAPPQNYSIKYEKPMANDVPQQVSQVAPQKFSVREDHHQPAAQPNQVYQHVPGKEHQVQNTPTKPEKEYTTSCEFKPSQQNVPVQVIEPVVQPPKAQRQTSTESLHEHNAVSSRVMSGPVSQQAVTVRQKSPMNRDQHDMDAAFSLKNTLQKFGKQDSITPKTSPARSPARSPNSFSYKPREQPESRSLNVSQSLKYKSEVDNFEINKYKPSDCPKPTVSPSNFKFRSTFDDTHKEVKNCGVVKPMQQQKHISIHNNTMNTTKPKYKPDNNRPTVMAGQFNVPVINVKSPELPRIPPQAQVLSKSDSWHEICKAHQTSNQKPVPKPGPVKSKSSHALAVPKMFEAGMSKDEMVNKRKSMEAFLTGNKSPSNEVGGKSVKRSINRIKTTQKVSTQSRSTGGLSRSRTLPGMVCPDLLDESNVDKAFDELFETS